MKREEAGYDGLNELSSHSHWPPKRPGPEQPQKRGACDPCCSAQRDRQGEGLSLTAG